jgi:hypothetical protein
MATYSTWPVSNGVTVIGILSDAGLALAYFAISAALLILAGKAQRVPHGLLVTLRLFEAFILLCGCTVRDAFL